jgi:lipoprotein-anchoring transpeptidase ErfK/SrfK
VLRSGQRVLRRASIGVGRPGSPTPTGRFAVTDKLDGAAINPVYGCCILALSAHQTNVPSGWRGGNRIAIHGGGTGAVSAGCVHAGETDLRYLMRVVPLGTPVTIHA